MVYFLGKGLKCLRKILFVLFFVSSGILREMTKTDESVAKVSVIISSKVLQVNMTYLTIKPNRTKLQTGLRTHFISDTHL